MKGRCSRLFGIALEAGRRLVRGGPRSFVRDLRNRRQREAAGPDRYQSWLRGRRAREQGADLAGERATIEDNSAPAVCLLMPVFNPPAEYLRAAVGSILAQTYPRWQLSIADDGSRPDVLDELGRLARGDRRITLARSELNTGIAAATNRALAAAREGFVAFLDHDDLLDPDALQAVAEALRAHPGADAVYTDRDSAGEDGRRRDPYFKPDWSPLALLSHNYAVHFLCIRRRLVEELGGLRSEFDGAQDHDLLLRLAERTAEVLHVPTPLYSWRQHPGSNLGTPRPASFDAGRRAILDALRRRGLSGTVELSAPAGPFRTRLAPAWEPLVSVIISSHDARLLSHCAEVLAARTTYPKLEILVATNALGDVGLSQLCRERGFTLVEVENGFFSPMNNQAARRARGDVLLFLNDDTEVVTPDWIEEMLSWLRLPGVAAVGPKLVYPDGRLQFSRVVMGIRSDGVPYFFDPFDHWGVPYLHGFSLDVATEVASVSGGCMVVRREEFLDSGGFVAGEFATSYQDVDWSIRVRAGARAIVYTPHAVVTHWGSFSKKRDERHLEREIRIATAFFTRHQATLSRSDPYWNANLLEPGGLLEPPRFPGLPLFPKGRG